MRHSSNLQDYVAERLAGLGVASYAVAAVRDDDVSFFADGTLRSGEAGTVTPATPFHICSCSKAFTALAFARLVEAGNADWDAPAAGVVPELRLADPWITEHYTFRDLAGMRLGLSRDGIAEWGFRQDAPTGRRLARARAMAFEAPFRDRFSYSNLNYIALACAVSRLAGVSFAECVKQLVFDPAGLRDASLEGSPGTAAPHMPCGDSLIAVPELTGANSQGSARVHLSARDAASWLDSSLSLWTGKDASGGSMEMFRPQSIVRPAADPASGIPSPWAYGFGWFLSEMDGAALVHHGGGGRGWRAMAVMEPARRRGVMVMLAHEGPAAEALAFELLDLLDGRAASDRLGVLAARAERDSAARNAAMDLRHRPPGALPPAAGLGGRYTHPVTGTVHVTAADAGRLRFAAEDAPVFDAILEPSDGDVFEFRFVNPALRSMPTDPLFQARFMVDDRKRVVAQTTYFGDLVQTAAAEGS